MHSASQQTLRRLSPPFEEDKYAEFLEVDEPVIKLECGMNEIQHVQCSTAEIAKEQAKDEVWSKAITWVERGGVPEKI